MIPSRFAMFNRKFFQTSNFSARIKWFGLKGLLPISNNRMVEITLDYGNRVGYYNRYIVKIINTIQTPVSISYNEFMFEELLSGAPRVDTRKDWSGHFYVDESANWYIGIPHPDAIANFVNLIDEYILIFHSEVKDEKSEKLPNSVQSRKRNSKKVGCIGSAIK